MADLLWLDLEYSNRDASKSRIMEVAAIATDWDFEELDSFEAVISLSEEELKVLDEPLVDYSSGREKVIGKVRQLHEETGLLDRMAESSITEEQAGEMLLDFISKNFTKAPILAGNSIHWDRKMILSRWPKVEKELHYRMLDITSYKLLFNQHAIRYEKDKAHRAMDDIKESIAELKFYLDKVDLPSVNNES